jgi:ferrochelatase
MNNNTYGCRGTKDRVGVLVAQLGSPDAPTPKAVRRYLKQFLMDPRVIEVYRPLWWLILNGIILNTRPKRSARLYSRIWWPEGAPLVKITERQTKALAEKLTKRDDSIVVEFGMRYGNPSLESAIDRMLEAGCGRILLLPMYPQYAAATTASIYDAVFKHLLKRRSVPVLRVVAPYYNDNRYLEALSATINKGLTELPFTPERLVLSYHGIPIKYVTKGDPYCCMCTESTEAFRHRINFAPEHIIHTYQSRFGRDPWLQPYTDRTIEALGEQGIKKLAVACPGFTADCLETLDEIGNEAHEAFLEHGGEELKLIPCVNDQPVFIEALEKIVVSELGGWIEPRTVHASGCYACPVQAALKEAQAR